MKISQMLAREPFGQILERTLAGYWGQRYGTSRCVRWYPGWPGLSRVRAGEEQLWPCLPELNAILSADADGPVRHWVRAMFADTPIHWRRPLLRAYVACATQRSIMPFAARSAMNVAPPLAEAPSLLIWPGNTRLRIFDFRQRRVAVVLKAGFADTSMRRELAVRAINQSGEWPIPPILAQDPAMTWFEEPLLGGVALNRCPGGGVLVEQAFNALDRWLEQTRAERPALEYVDQVQASVRNELTRVAIFDAPTRTKINRWLDAALELIHRLSRRTRDSLVLAVGHGDFQPGNVLVGDSQTVWLLDWEHSGERQYLYDFLVFGLSSRFSAGLSERLAGLLAGLEKSLLHPELWLSRLPTDTLYRRLLLVIFLLEELDWYIRENNNPLFCCPTGGWSQFSGEMETALSYLGQDIPSCA
jgi:hypothetical protein